MADPYGKPFPYSTDTSIAPTGLRPLPRTVTPGPTHHVHWDIKEKPPKRKDNTDKGDTAYIVHKNNYVQCTKCKSALCEHVHRVLKKNLDAEPFWKKLESAAELKFLVPMVLSENLWAYVALRCDETLIDTYEVSLIQKENSSRESFVGYLHLGEGRYVLRSMVFNWFMGHVEYKKLQCESSLHKYEAEMNWQQHQKSSKKMAEYWSVWNDKLCLTCRKGVNADDSDLVPDAGNYKYPR